jgi:hypothetical protein
MPFAASRPRCVSCRRLGKPNGQGYQIGVQTRAMGGQDWVRWTGPKDVNSKKSVVAVGQHDHKIKVQLAFIAMAVGAPPVRSCLPQHFGPKNTGEDCELAEKKKNDNRVVHDLLLCRPATRGQAQTDTAPVRPGSVRCSMANEKATTLHRRIPLCQPRSQS